MRVVFVGSAILLISFLAAGQQVEGGFDRSVSVSGNVELDATTDSGGIVITPGAAGTVKVHAILKAHRNSRWSVAELENRIREIERNPPIEQSGNIVRIGHLRDKSLQRGVSMRLEITAPSESRVRATADSGGVRVTGMRGPIDCQTDSGGIEVTDASGDVKATADSGGIRIRNVNGRVVAHADSGGIEVTDVAGPVEANADSGGIRISQTAPGPIVARADSGGARIKLASGAGYDVKASSDSGRVTVPDVTVHGNLSRRRVEGKVRGGGPLVDVSVDSGNVEIE